jgi:putative DNA primase/helicase
MMDKIEQPNITYLTCPECGQPVNESNMDDVGTQFYKCKNSHVTAHPHENVYRPMPYVQFESWCVDGVFNHPRFAKDIIDNYSIHTNVETDDLYIFNVTTGIYDKNGDVALRRIIDNCLEKESRKDRANETIYLIHVRTSDKLQESSKIAVQNGLLDVVTGELVPFTPNEFVTAQLPVTYDKTAQCPEILKFFSEIAPDDLKAQFEEIFGYSLLRELPIHKATVLLGEGANGKSTFLDLLTLFLGKDNVSHVTLQQMCEGKFELAELHGKLANIVDDLPGSALKAVGNFKTITGNAPILVQRKHKDPFSEWSTTKQFFGCNKLPKASEDTIAYFRRFNIVPFNRFFTGKADDKNKLKKMTTASELSGLLNLALSGLKRLMQNGDYSGAKSIEDTRQLYIKSSDSCKAFCEEKLDESDDPKDYLTTDNTYQLYVTYVRENRLPKIEAKPQLSQAIRQTFPNVEHTKVTSSNSWVWQYLKNKNSPPTPVNPPLGIWPLETISKEQIEKAGTSGAVGTEQPPRNDSKLETALGHKPP